MTLYACYSYQRGRWQALVQGTNLVDLQLETGQRLPVVLNLSKQAPWGIYSHVLKVEERLSLAVSGGVTD